MAPGALAQVLGDLPNVHNDNLLVGFDTSDDASVFRVGENLGLVQSVDFFPPMVDDPFLFGQIAAANSLSDIYAMGGRPSHAMNLLCIPNCLGVEVAGQILAGGADKCVEAGCAIAGGHTINDDEPKYGLSVSGFVALDRMLANSGACVGDVLLLTKAVGSGIITTAIKGELIEQDEVAAMFDSMRTLNEAPIRLAEGLELHGCTDVTGFGLIGHACEMRARACRLSSRRGRCRSLIRCSIWRVWALSPRVPTATRTSSARVWLSTRTWSRACWMRCTIRRPRAACLSRRLRRMWMSLRVAWMPRGASLPLLGACARRSRAVLPSALFASPHVYVTVYRSLERFFRKDFAMSTKIEVNAMGDACPLPVVKTLKALKQLDGEGAVVTSVDNETAVKNISKMAQEKGCAASVEKISDAEWHVTVATAGAVAVADPEQDGAAFCDASAGKGKLVISVYTDCMGRGDDELGHKLMKAFIFAVTQQEELPATMLFYNGGAKLTVEGSPVLDDLKGLAEQGVEILTCGTCLDHFGIKDQLAVGEVTNMYVIVEKMEQAVRVVRP